MSHKYSVHSLYMKKPTFPLKRFDSWKLRRVDKHPNTSQFHRISAYLCKLATSSSQLCSFQQAHCTHNPKKLSLIHATETLHSSNKTEKTQKLDISSPFFFFDRDQVPVSRELRDNIHSHHLCPIWAKQAKELQETRHRASTQDSDKAPGLSP